jgi:hypothetical protein
LGGFADMRCLVVMLLLLSTASNCIKPLQVAAVVALCFNPPMHQHPQLSKSLPPNC